MIIICVLLECFKPSAEVILIFHSIRNLVLLYFNLEYIAIGNMMSFLNESLIVMAMQDEVL
jgi:hypothetical protein